MDKNILKGSSALAFTVSGIFTIMLMTSGIVGIIATFLMVIIAVILELSKCGLFYFSIYGKVGAAKLPAAIRVICFIVAILLFLSSMIASLSFLQNNNNRTKNLAVESSQESQNKAANISSQSDLIAAKKDEIETLNTSLKDIKATSKDSIKDLRNRNLKTNANNLQEQTNKNIDNITNKINKANGELTTLTGNLQTIRSKEVKADSSNTKGYTAFLKVIAENMNKAPERKDDPVSTEEIETWFFGILGIIFEIVAVMLFYLSRLSQESAAGETEATKEEPERDNITILDDKKKAL